MAKKPLIIGKKIFLSSTLIVILIAVGLLLFTYTGKTIIRQIFDIPMRDVKIGVTKEQLKEQRAKNLSRPEDG